MKTYEIEYFHNGKRCVGFVAEPENLRTDTAVILIVHMWSGRVPFVEEKAIEMAQKGYIGFAIDMYGDGKIGKSINENTQLMQAFLDDRKLMQDRIQAGFDAISQINHANSKQVVAMGYCFGGLCAQDLARVNTQVLGVISIHGLMLEAENIEHGKFAAKMLLLNGADDPMVSQEHWEKLRRELDYAKCDWQKHDFGGVMHAFTNPQANDKSMGTVYNSRADKRSERLILNFIEECFSESII
jgi:dienelactone hydrolase